VNLEEVRETLETGFRYCAKLPWK